MYDDEPQLAADLIKPRKPDRVTGLARTAAFEKVLNSAVSPALRCSPFALSNGYDNLFPFLVLEAKSEKSPDDLRHIRTQTAFPIRTLLRLQAGLLAANGKRAADYAFPLVWFIAYSGSDWTVSVAYMESGDADKYVSTPVTLKCWEADLLDLFACVEWRCKAL